MNKSIPCLNPCQFKLTLEEFSKLIDSKNRALVEEKKSNYHYVDFSGKQQRPLTPTSTGHLEESFKFNLSSVSEDSCSPNVSSSASSSISTRRLRLKGLRVSEPNRIIENPFRKMAVIKYDSADKEFQKHTDQH